MLYNSEFRIKYLILQVSQIAVRFYQTALAEYYLIYLIKEDHCYVEIAVISSWSSFVATFGRRESLTKGDIWRRLIRVIDTEQ